MSYPLRKIEYENQYKYKPDGHKIKVIKNKKKKQKKNFFAVLFSLAILSLYAYYICPYNYNHYLRPIFINRFLNRNLDFNVAQYMSPTLDYFYNTRVLKQNIRVNKIQSTKQMADIKIVNEMSELKSQLLKMFEAYPDLHPSIFVWEYSTNSGFEINADELFPSASVIKLPIACELIRLVDKTSKTPSPIFLSDKRTFTEFYRTLGSGNLQRTKADVGYTLDYLAGIMISDSDNSATNMILNEIGGVDGFNRAMRNLGLNHISMHDWLPDLDGTNKITAREISKVIYNIDNPNYINPKYKNVLKEYLGNTKNTHLIKEKLPPDVMVLHKTGDIASVLSDAGVVYTNNGKKYIMTMLVKRPANSYSAKTLIQETSKIVYDSMVNL